MIYGEGNNCKLMRTLVYIHVHLTKLYAYMGFVPTFIYCWRKVMINNEKNLLFLFVTT